MGIIKIYHDKKWTLQFLDALYNSIDILEMYQNRKTLLHIISKLGIWKNIFYWHLFYLF
jgi:hypothetical protein